MDTRRLGVHIPVIYIPALQYQIAPDDKICLVVTATFHDADQRIVSQQ